MSKVVVDSSVLIAYLHKEPLSVDLADGTGTVVSSVNLAETLSKLILYGATEQQAWADATELADELIPFSPEHARLAGSLISSTRQYGLSLGDRACLALALALGLPVYTTDRVWKEVNVGVEVIIVR